MRHFIKIALARSKTKSQYEKCKHSHTVLDVIISNIYLGTTRQRVLLVVLWTFNVKFGFKLC